MDIALSPNWSPLVLVVLLGVICTFLFLAMQRQMRRMHANWSPERPGPEASTSASSAASASSPGHPDSADRRDPDAG